MCGGSETAHGGDPAHRLIVEYGGTVVTLTNFTGPETEFGSLRDGRYTLTALASQISAGSQALDGDAGQTPRLYVKQARPYPARGTAGQ